MQIWCYSCLYLPKELFIKHFDRSNFADLIIICMTAIGIILLSVYLAILRKRSRCKEIQLWKLSAGATIVGLL